MNSTTNQPRRLRISTRLHGRGNHKGRRTVDPSYVRAMLRSKIVVVSQRDEWEDHWRLFEALVSGAMVMADEMQSMPLCLQDEVSLVVYRGEQDLVDKILYYLGHERERLAIAGAGRTIAMEQHRSWPRKEKIVLGRAMSNQPFSSPDDNDKSSA